MKKFSVLAALLGLMVIFACGGGGSSDSSNSNDNSSVVVLKKIVFVGYESGSVKGDIYTMNEDGSEIVNLTNTPDVNELASKWSPDGTKIYFLRDESQRNLYVMNADGSNQVKVTDQKVYGLDYDISPDGSKIAFYSHDGTDNEIYVVNSDGTGLTNLSNNDYSDTCPSWSPDGETIAWVVDQGDPTGKDLYKQKYNEASGSFITEGPGDVSVTHKPIWSPDGTQIAYTRYGNFYMSHNYELFTINLSGGTPTNISNNSNNDYYPLWSPDGSKIAFVSDRDGNFNIYLWTGSSIVTKLTDSTAKDVQHSWSPDGTKIVFVSERDTPGRGQIYVMNADGSNQTRLSIDDTMNHQSPKWQP